MTSERSENGQEAVAPPTDEKNDAPGRGSQAVARKRGLPDATEQGTTQSVRLRDQEINRLCFDSAARGV